MNEALSTPRFLVAETDSVESVVAASHIASCAPIANLLCFVSPVRLSHNESVTASVSKTEDSCSRHAYLLFKAHKRATFSLSGVFTTEREAVPWLQCTGLLRTHGVMPQSLEERKRKRKELMRQTRRQQKEYEQSLVQQVMRLEREHAELRTENQQLFNLLQLFLFYRSAEMLPAVSAAVTSSAAAEGQQLST